MALVSCSPSFSRMCHKSFASPQEHPRRSADPPRAVAALGISRLLVWIAALLLISIWKHIYSS